jgi:glycosyltransferase involved in cell wall biosynthesis
VSLAVNKSHRTPTVSLGLPVFNGEPYFATALEQMLGQTYGDFELIISDNASTDGTQDIARAYGARDKRIRYFRQASNIGIGNNWSFVARHARGPWLKWVSANDEYLPQLLEECLVPLQRNPDVVLSYGRTQFIDLEGNKLEVYDGDFDILSDDPLERYRFARAHLHLSTTIQSGIVRTDAVRRCGYMGNYRDSDRVLIFGLALAGKFVLLPQIHFFRRWDKSTATPLRSALEVRQMYEPDATHAPMFINLPRQFGHLGVALRVPFGSYAKARTLAAALRYTNWIGKMLGRDEPKDPLYPTASD